MVGWTFDTEDVLVELWELVVVAEGVVLPVAPGVVELVVKDDYYGEMGDIYE